MIPVGVTGTQSVSDLIEAELATIATGDITPLIIDDVAEENLADKFVTAICDGMLWPEFYNP